MITCRAENVFSVQETEVELTVLGNFLFYFYFFMQNVSFNPRTYCSKRFCLQDEVHFIFGTSDVSKAKIAREISYG